jgi:nucleoside-diphosphate-sugar epimerase
VLTFQDNHAEASVSSPQGGVRSRRSAITVAVAGAASPAGVGILRALVGAAGRGVPAVPGGHGSAARIGTVIGVAPEPGEVGGVEWRVGDDTTPEFVQALAGADAVVFVAGGTDLGADLRLTARQRRERSLRRAQTVITAAAAAGAAHLIAVTSAMVYGARDDNPLPLDDHAPLRATVDTGVVGDLMDVEQLLAVTADVHPGLLVTVLRPAALVGPGVDTVITRHFEAPRLLTVRGSSPAWQFCHVEDLGSAVAVAATHRLSGPLTVGSEGWLEQAEVEQLSGMRRVELSEATALGTAQRLHRIGVLPTPASDLAFALHPWAVSSARLRAEGWLPAYDNATCLGVVLDGVRGSLAVAARRVDRRDAALGAASAAVAMVGTAAIMRRRRRRGGRA